LKENEVRHDIYILFNENEVEFFLIYFVE